ncbi:MAG TPA: MFS transporter [Pseudomonadales bacterium]|nr:MFS transporter [Pseudomonadales bacterium]
MVAVAFFVDFIAVGFFFYSYGVFFKALAEEFGGARLDVSIGLTLVNVVGGLLGPFIGRALDRYPIKWVIVAGTLAMSLGFLLLSQIEARWQFYLVLATLIGFGSNAMGGLATAKLVANWFERKRGTALGIATMGISLSGVVMPLVSAWLIAEFGWRGGFLVFGGFTLLLVLPVVMAFVVSSPEDIGLGPDGDHYSVDDPPRKRVQASTGALLKERNFWMTTLAVGFLFCAMGATLTHMVPRVTDLGFTLLQAAPILSFGAGAGVLGKVIFGWIVDRLDPRLAVLAAIGSQMVGQIGMLYFDSYLGFALSATVFGFGMGGVVPLHGAIAGIAFGRENFGKVMGLMRPAMMPLQVTGLPFAGWVFDTYGNYDMAFQLFLGLYVLSAVCIWGLRLPSRDDPDRIRPLASS